MGARAGLTVTLLLACGCGQDAVTTEPSAAPDAGRACVAGEITGEDGACKPAGVIACAEGFTLDGAGGCVASLPEAACAKGTLALPGETECREVAPCGVGDYGDAPPDPGTQHVNAAYTGGGSDGSAAKPWLKIQDALNAASAGGAIAIAAGRYEESLRVSRGVRIFAKCPAQVEVHGPDAAAPAVYVTASGVEIHALAVRAAGEGIFVDGGRDVLLDRLWIHDTGDAALDMDDTRAVANVTLRDSLVEGGRRFGVVDIGSELLLDRTVIRDTAASAGEPATGHGLECQNDRQTQRAAKLTMRSSIVEHSVDIGVALAATEATIEASLVRDTKVGANPSLARGVLIQGDPPQGGRGSLTMRGVVLERNAIESLMADGSDLTVENITVRDTTPGASRYGSALVAQANTTARTTLTARSSLFERSAEAGIVLSGADATFDGVLVRDVASIASGILGHGIVVGFGPRVSDRSNALVRGSLIDRASEAGIVVYGADAEIQMTLVRDTRAAGDGSLGDGIAIIREQNEASAKIASSRVEASARAGISVFGGVVSVGSTTIECSQLPLVSEEYAGAAASFDNQGQNVCRCGAQEAACTALSSKITPPRAPKAL